MAADNFYLIYVHGCNSNVIYETKLDWYRRFFVKLVKKLMFMNLFIQLHAFLYILLQSIQEKTMMVV